MPYKDPEKRRECRRRWYANHTESEKQHVIRRKKEIKKWFNDFKKTLKCTICRENHPATLDFHHPNRKNKEKEIGFLVSEGYSINRIKREIEKCQVLCSNCHRKIHFIF